MISRGDRSGEDSGFPEDAWSNDLYHRHVSSVPSWSVSDVCGYLQNFMMFSSISGTLLLRTCGLIPACRRGPWTHEHCVCTLAADSLMSAWILKLILGQNVVETFGPTAAVDSSSHCVVRTGRFRENPHASVTTYCQNRFLLLVPATWMVPLCFHIQIIDTS